ncbi:hypothetical protein PV08_01252 [Exophiala spinifera]|uniref:EthD domain-containing protein n=1 Tax=Exophiala spinifera TaxID=91928 RepID=A0A0D2BQA3_9EURO|nr:uncharacterized protein PV08_01252 [Exophiala spinifera]KIW20675.1 hypothetical protein PV08_01252 [Exophiala spinifera]
MAIGAVVLYPASPDATFDMTYYLTRHKPLCVERWGKYGFKDITVLKVNASAAEGEKPAYSVIATLTWDDDGKGDGIAKALTGEDGEAVMGDIPNFSNKTPLFLMGDVAR